jgi:hypothetical protein
MKRLLILVCVLALLLSLPGAASAAKPEEGTFTIAGAATSYTYEIRPNGHVKFYMTAAGSVTGYFAGTFTFEEEGEVELLPPFPPGIPGKGKSKGIMTITTDLGQVVIKFHGKSEYLTTWGKFEVRHKECTGEYEGLHGDGDYIGDAGVMFTVVFTGKFHD